MPRRSPQGEDGPSMKLGPVTVAAERRGLLTRWRMPVAGSNPAWSSILLRANALRRTSLALRAKQDALRSLGEGGPIHVSVPQSAEGSR